MHEYVHAVLTTLPVAVPSWFHEGLAQHFEARRPPPATRLARLGVVTPDALQTPFARLPTDVVPAAYATAHALVVRLVERRGQWGLHQLVAELKSGRDFADAFQRTFAVTVDELYREVASSPP